MITESYSEEREALFSPGAFLDERKYLCDTAIATFSGEIYQAVIDKYPHREVGNISSANGRKPIYAIEINGKEIVFYLSSIGACLAGTEIIEMEWQTGVKSLIVFGSCGALDSEATNGKYIVPTQAYRDEGMSYHYVHCPDTGVPRRGDVLSLRAAVGLHGHQKRRPPCSDIGTAAPTVCQRSNLDNGRAVPRNQNSR